MKLLVVLLGSLSPLLCFDMPFVCGSDSWLWPLCRAGLPQGSASGKSREFLFIVRNGDLIRGPNNANIVFLYADATFQAVNWTFLFFRIGIAVSFSGWWLLGRMIELIQLILRRLFEMDRGALTVFGSLLTGLGAFTDWVYR